MFLHVCVCLLDSFSLLLLIAVFNRPSAFTVLILANENTIPFFMLLAGVLLISLALCADAVIGNVQEKVMKKHDATNSEMVHGPLRCFRFFNMLFYSRFFIHISLVSFIYLPGKYYQANYYQPYPFVARYKLAIIYTHVVALHLNCL